MLMNVIYPDGSKYEGKCKYGLPHGYGTLENPDGSRYEGECP